MFSNLKSLLTTSWEVDLPYLAHPNITHTIGVVSQYMHALPIVLPKRRCWTRTISTSLSVTSFRMSIGLVVILMMVHLWLLY